MSELPTDSLTLRATIANGAPLVEGFGNVERATAYEIGLLIGAMTQRLEDLRSATATMLLREGQELLEKMGDGLKQGRLLQSQADSSYALQKLGRRQ